ncbi:MAG TPA: HEAT repeat domain-containing protein [Candidatus Dormibacteraeota bacterium]|nr:HEAT repeat domain-containing protein [Candidatus Dormibacteraeota bacterium]
MARTVGIICGASLSSICLLSTLFGQSTQYRSGSASVLVEQFNNTAIFWKQFEVAKNIVALHDKSVLQDLEPWLSNEDMLRRGNAAFIFASLGDDRGFQVIKAILEDRSSRRAVFETSVREQIREDRYYAVYLFGHLKDSRAFPIIVPLLNDKDVNQIVAWSLGQLGDKSAIRPLIERLEDRDPHMRVAAISALGKLDATEALPKLHSILDEAEVLMVIPDYGLVAKVTRAVIAKLEEMPQ